MSQLAIIRAGTGGGLRSLIRRAAVAAGAAVTLLGLAVWAAGPAAAIPGPAVLYAYAGGMAASTVTSCPQDTATPPNPAAECSLTEALTLASPGATIALATPGGTAHYVGNWTINTANTTATAPVTIQPAPGLASPPVLDGNKGASTGCTTAACDGPVLTVPSGEYVSLTGITITNGDNSAASFAVGGGLENAGTVTITGSTFTGNTATWDGGAIDNADGGNTGGGSVTVTASTFAGNTARVGGAIASGAWGGFGTVQVTASTFTGNTTRIGGGNGLGGYGGAIAIGYAGNGSATVTASTFSGNTAEAAGGAIASGGNGGGGTMTVAGDLFNGSCAQVRGPWTDGGYNAGTDKTCFASTPQTGDTSGSAVGSDLQTGLTGNGGPTQTIKPTTGNPAIGLIPDPTTITLGSNRVALCPALDQRGYPSAASTACDAGAVQTSGWPPQVSGTHRPAARAAEGYRLGAAGNTWKLYVTHPGTTNVSFTGKVSVPAGTLGHLTLINPTTGHQVSITGTAITFTLPDSGTVTGFSFTTTATVAKITFTLDIGGHPATPSQLFLGGTAAHPASGSPLTFTR